jgi:hypothetical protein
VLDYVRLQFEAFVNDETWLALSPLSRLRGGTFNIATAKGGNNVERK